MTIAYDPRLLQERIVHIDENFIVADKPSGLLSVPGRGADKADCLVTRLQKQFADALTVHRLDMETSGLMVFARNLNAQRQLGRAFEQRQTEKNYTAVLQGQLAREQGSVDLPLICDWPNRPRQMVDHAIGKPALTHFLRLSVDVEHHTSRVTLTPVTGRSHQLRVHMASLGHPIMGDSLYQQPVPSPVPERLYLHATELSFPHPATGQRVHFHSPAPF